MESAKMKVYYKGKALIEDGMIAYSLSSRMKGLLGTQSLRAGQGILITNCKQVHTFFMKYPIDVIFLDSKNNVLKSTTMKPWRISPWILRAEKVLETPAGISQSLGLTAGSKLEVNIL